MFSRREDITLANPFGGVRRGRADVVAELEHASLFYRDGEVVAFEDAARVVTPDLAFIVEIERYRAKFGGSQDLTPRNIRVTSVFRPENGVWKLLHRHADALVSPQTPETVTQR